MSKSNCEKGKEEKEPQFPSARDCEGASGAEAIRGRGGEDAARGGERKGQEGSVNYRRAKEARRDTASGEDRTERCAQSSSPGLEEGERRREEGLEAP